MDEQEFARVIKDVKEEAEFRGFMKSQLGMMLDGLRKMESDLACQARDLGALRTKVATWSAIIALVVSVGSGLLMRLVK